MTWNRAAVAVALADELEKWAADDGDTVAIFDRQPSTLNPPAIVIGRPTDVTFGAFSFGIDRATLPVLCIAGTADGDDRVAELVALVRGCVEAAPTLDGAVQGVTATAERNWRNQTLGGVELVVADCVLDLTM